ncbi:MAG: hypothetical protein IBJ19_16700, partial [Gemmatimonadaceae bacterium]|nr:hypothetical protein [Gemmatimonadaceae bacterium]
MSSRAPAPVRRSAAAARWAAQVVGVTARGGSATATCHAAQNDAGGGARASRRADFRSKRRGGGSAFGSLASFMSVFSGGSFQHSTIFGLGIMPYITAGIIFQLL